MTPRPTARIVACLAAGVLAGLMLGASPARAAERYTLIVSGASGGGKYAADYLKWRTTLAAALRDKLAFDAGRIVVLSEAAEAERSTAEGVRRAVTALRERAGRDDLLLVT